MTRNNNSEEPSRDKIAIGFTEMEWKYIVEVLSDDLIYHSGLITSEAETLASKITSRISEEIYFRENKQ